jgi:hypothetical protein
MARKPKKGALKMIIKHYYNPLLLVWKWTTSRAQESDGWNICTLYADGQKVGKTTGGGYDMRGTAYGQFIEAQYQDRLLKLHRRAGSRYSVSPSGDYKRLKTKKAHSWSNHGELYGLTAYYNRGEAKPFRIGLDGGCGFTSMRKISRAIGLAFKWHTEGKATTSGTLTDKKL